MVAPNIFGFSVWNLTLFHTANIQNFEVVSIFLEKLWTLDLTLQFLEHFALFYEGETKIIRNVGTCYAVATLHLVYLSPTIVVQM
jgi:hypothetical protein